MFGNGILLINAPGDLQPEMLDDVLRALGLVPQAPAEEPATPAPAPQLKPELHARPGIVRDDEWNRKRTTHYREITGSLAYWAVRQIPDDRPCFPPRLEFAVGFLHTMIRPRFDEQGWAELSLRDISQMLYDVLMPEKFFAAWNDENVMGQGWLDLDALIRNVCVTIRDERRAFDEFNNDFDRRYGKAVPAATAEANEGQGSGGNDGPCGGPEPCCCSQPCQGCPEEAVRNQQNQSAPPSNPREAVFLDALNSLATIYGMAAEHAAKVFTNTVEQLNRLS